MSDQVVRDAMVPEPTMLGADENAQAGGRCLENPEIRAVFVCEADGTLVGVITRKTLVREVVAAGLHPTEVLLRTSVLRVITPTSVPSASHTNTARISGFSRQRPPSCAFSPAPSIVGSGTIASRTTCSLTGRSRAPRARPRPHGSPRPSRIAAV